MKFSYRWLSELVDGLAVTPKELAGLITLKTAEQEGVEEAGAALDQVCAARILSLESIEGSHNRKAVVDTGRYGTRTVVCGAANARVGMVTAFVPTGVTLGSKRIETAVISGVESEGMLASGAELGLNRDSAGILDLDAEPGAPLPGCAPDWLIEIDNKSLTHRPDLWGHHGMAREAAAILNRPLRDPVRLDLLPSGDSPVDVTIDDYAIAPRYSAVVFDNVTVGPSPLWLQYRLESIGLNPISNIVDITNLVMAEIAQPMHAFDKDKLHGNRIAVRAAREGERITALNGETYDLDARALVIADEAGPVAIAGVIGGLDSGVTASTTRIVFESANFHAGSIRKTSSRLKLRTDASMRFEKSQDPHNTVRGLARAVELMALVSPGARLVGGLADAYQPKDPPEQIELPLEWLDRKLGKHVPEPEVRGILESLEFGVREKHKGVLLVTVPSWRATKDISIKDDLVEEVGRMIGYTSIDPVAPHLPAVPPPSNPERDYFTHVRAVATGQGFTEVHNYSFVSEAQIAELGLDAATHVRVLNPIASDQGLLRTSLAAGLLKNVRDNSRHFEACRFFEIGFAIESQGSAFPRQTPHLGAVIYSRHGDGVTGLLEAKRLVECLLPGATVAATPPHPWEHPARSHAIFWRGHEAGRIAEFHPSLAEGRAAVADVDLAVVQQAGAQPKRYQPLRRFPASEFDLSVVAPLRTPAGALDAVLRKAAGEHVVAVSYLTQYTGKPLPDDRKSVSFRITVGAADRTLATPEINSVRATLIAALEQAGFELRI